MESKGSPRDARIAPMLTGGLPRGLLGESLQALHVTEILTRSVKRRLGLILGRLAFRLSRGPEGATTLNEATNVEPNSTIVRNSKPYPCLQPSMNATTNPQENACPA